MGVGAAGLGDEDEAAPSNVDDCLKLLNLAERAEAERDQEVKENLNGAAGRLHGENDDKDMGKKLGAGEGGEAAFGKDRGAEDELDQDHHTQKKDNDADAEDADLGGDYARKLNRCLLWIIHAYSQDRENFDLWLDAVKEEVKWLKKEDEVFLDEFKNSGELLKDIDFDQPLQICKDND